MPQSIQCLTCKHYLGIQECDAFPGGIPQEIYTGEYDHREPFPGDGGVRWEATDEGAAELIGQETGA